MLGDEKGEAGKSNGRASGNNRRTPKDPQQPDRQGGEKEGNLEESWGSLQIAAAEMLGEDVLKNSPDPKSKGGGDNHSVHTSSA